MDTESSVLWGCAMYHWTIRTPPQERLSLSPSSQTSLSVGLLVRAAWPTQFKGYQEIKACLKLFFFFWGWGGEVVVLSML